MSTRSPYPSTEPAQFCLPPGPQIQEHGAVDFVEGYDIELIESPDSPITSTSSVIGQIIER